MATGKASTSAVKAGEAFVELFADDSKFNQTLKRTSDKWANFLKVLNTQTPASLFSIGISGALNIVGSLIKSIGQSVTNLGRGFAIIGTSAVTAFGVAGIAALRHASRISIAATQLSSTTEEYSRLAYAAEKAGIAYEVLEDKSRNLIEQTKNAANGSEDAEAAFRKIGMTARQFSHLGIDEQFVVLSEALNRMPDQLDRNRILLSLFGEEGSRLLPLFNQGADGLREWFKEAENVGAVLNSIDAKKSREAVQSFDTVLKAAKASFLEIGFAILEFAGEAKEVQRVILMYLKMFREWAKENRATVATIAIISAAVTGLGIALIGVGAIIGIIGGAITGVVAIFSALAAVASVVTLKLVIVAGVIAALVAGVGYLIYKFFTATETGKKLGTALVETFKQVGEIATKTFSGIADSLLKGDIDLAWKIFTQGLLTVWLNLVVDMKNGWYSFTNILEDTLLDVVARVQGIFAGMFNEFKKVALEAVIFISKKSVELLNDLGGNPNLKMLIALKTEPLTKELESLQKKVNDTRAPFIKQAEEAKKLRNAEQLAELQKAADQYGQASDILDRLIKEAKKPAVVPAPGPEIAPMPREKGLLDLNMRKFGDSARGTFDSTDFRGTLGLGEANSYAKQAVDIQRNMLNELKAINTNLSANMFT